MVYKWKDETSYSRTNKERTPSTWKITLEEIGYDIIVTRHIYYKDTWLLSCRKIDIDMCNLKTNDIEEAKQKALQIVEERLNELVEKALNEIENLK